MALPVRRSASSPANRSRLTAEVTLSRGQRRAVEAIYVPDQDDRGVVRGYFALVVDVTDRKHAEQEARQIRDELAHAGRIATMGEMAAALAHELNQPLAAILSNAQAAKRFLIRPQPGPGGSSRHPPRHRRR